MATGEALCPLCGEGCTCDEPIPYEVADQAGGGSPAPKSGDVEPHATIRFTTAPDGELNVKIIFEPDMNNRPGAENPVHVHAALMAFQLFCEKFGEGVK